MRKLIQQYCVNASNSVSSSISTKLDINSRRELQTQQTLSTSSSRVPRTDIGEQLRQQALSHKVALREPQGDKRKVVLILILFTFLNCNFFDKAERGVSPFAKFLSLLNIDRTATTVTSVLPKDKSTGNYLNTNVFIVMNKNVSGFTTSNFTLSPDGGVTNHPGSVVILENVIGFYPSQNFIANATYKGTLKAENGLATEFTFTNGMGTTTDTTPPSISSTNPITGDTNMPINITISATFSEVIDPNTINSSSFVISNGVIGTVAITDQTVSFKPSSNLPANTTLSATIKAGVKDLAGNIMSSTYSWTFTTGSTVASDCTYDLSFYDTCLFNN